MKLYYMSFTGKVTKKYTHRGAIIDYINSKTNQKDRVLCTYELYINVNVNDTIIKMPNSNSCIIKNKLKNVKVDCYDIDFLD